MPVNLSIKNAPDDVVERLRQRAENNHRSLQGELLAIIEAAARQDAKRTPAILATVRALGLHSDADSTDIVRAARDGRQGH
jgi:antitoxin FitA